MGIDIYMRWDGQTEEEQQAQYTGFSTRHGHVGYLREAYHGEVYATRVLVPEAFDEDLYDEDPNLCGAPIPAATLRARLDETLAACTKRNRDTYGREPAPESLNSYRDFVELAERKEAEMGKPVRVYASA